MFDDTASDADRIGESHEANPCKSSLRDCNHGDCTHGDWGSHSQIMKGIFYLKAPMSRSTLDVKIWFMTKNIDPWYPILAVFVEISVTHLYSDYSGWSSTEHLSHPIPFSMHRTSRFRSTVGSLSLLWLGISACFGSIFVAASTYPRGMMLRSYWWDHRQLCVYTWLSYDCIDIYRLYVSVFRYIYIYVYVHTYISCKYIQRYVQTYSLHA